MRESFSFFKMCVFFYLRSQSFYLLLYSTNLFPSAVQRFSAFTSVLIFIVASNIILLSQTHLLWGQFCRKPVNPSVGPFSHDLKWMLKNTRIFHSFYLLHFCYLFNFFGAFTHQKKKKKKPETKYTCIWCILQKSLISVEMHRLPRKICCFFYLFFLLCMSRIFKKKVCKNLPSHL